MNKSQEVSNSKAVDQQIVRMKDYIRSIRRFIFDVWGLVPQPVKPEYQKQWDEACRASGELWERKKKEIKAEWFGDCRNPEAKEEVREWVWYDFQKGKHFTWQQNVILIGVEKAVVGDAHRHMSTVSGHGIGKSATCAWIILWFLYCYYEAQVPVTAPTSAQMHDVLWKELAIWIGRMPEEFRELYDWQHDYIRMNYLPESWFARARTSTKENTEAIAGVHSDNVAIIVDEASGVPEQVFITAQGALTSGNVFVIMISNGTRTIGYFYDSHHKDASGHQRFQFNSEESPIVDKQYVERMLKKYDRGSEEFKIRVAGGFPGEDIMDDSGYIQLIPENKIIVRVKEEFDIPFLGRRILGIDPSGEGKDKATFVVRDAFKAALVHSRQTTNDRQIAEDALLLIDRYNIDPADVVIGAFGSGADVGKHIALATKNLKRAFEVYTVMEGNTPAQEEKYNGQFFRRFDDELINPDGKTKEYVDLFLNIRALMHFRARKWLIRGGQIVDTSVDNSPFKEELVVLRYKRTLHGNKIQMMSKKEMLKLRIPSPNIADAFGLTFLREMPTLEQSLSEREQLLMEQQVSDDEDKFNAL